MIGEKIKSALDKSGLSIQEVARKMNTSTSNLYNLFKKEDIGSRYLKEFSTILGVPISYFFENYTEIQRMPQKSIDNGKFGSEVEEELRAQVEMLKKDKEFLQRILETTLDKIAAELGKEEGTNAKRLCLVPIGDVEPAKEAA